MTSGKVIISCAITGAIHTPSMSPFLPYINTYPPKKKAVAIATASNFQDAGKRTTVDG